MASPLPANASSLGSILPTRSGWWKMDPLDGATRRKRQLAFVKRSPYLLAFCALVAGVGLYYGVLANGKILVLFIFGVLVTRSLMLDFVRPTSPSPINGFSVWAVLAPMLAINGTAGSVSWITSMGRMPCGLACMWGTVFLLFRLFREPFLHFMEATSEPSIAKLPRHSVDNGTTSLPPY